MKLINNLIKLTTVKPPKGIKFFHQSVSKLNASKDSERQYKLLYENEQKKSNDIRTLFFKYYGLFKEHITYQDIYKIKHYRKEHDEYQEIENTINNNLAKTECIKYKRKICRLEEKILELDLKRIYLTKALKDLDNIELNSEKHKNTLAVTNESITTLTTEIDLLKETKKVYEAKIKSLETKVNGLDKNVELEHNLDEISNKLY